jgi:hypothetical protein
VVITSDGRTIWYSGYPFSTQTFPLMHLASLDIHGGSRSFLTCRLHTGPSNRILRPQVVGSRARATTLSLNLVSVPQPHLANQPPTARVRPSSSSPSHNDTRLSSRLPAILHTPRWWSTWVQLPEVGLKWLAMHLARTAKFSR